MLVFLDTNVYIGAKYQFDDGKLGTLKKLVTDGKISVLYTNATLGEINQHIENDMVGAIKEYNKILHKKIPALHKLYSLQELDANNAINCMKEKVREFLELDGVNIVPLNPLDAEKLLEDYFLKNAPFEDKKPYEFKDAIMINAIKNYQKSVNKPICIVSNDKGFRKAFEGNDNFTVFECLNDFLKHYYFEDMQETMKYVSQEVANGRFDDMLKEYLDNLDIDISYYVQWECNSKEIDNISSRLLYIKTEDEKKVAIISSEVSISIDITYRDENMSYYDSEEGRYIIEQYVNAIENHKVQIETEWEYEIKTDLNKKRIIEKIEIDGKNWRIIDLDENTLKNREEIEANEESETEYCTQCGKSLLNEDIYEDYEGRTLCSNCMKTDSVGEICPGCGKKVPSQYMMAGYCQECIQKR